MKRGYIRLSRAGPPLEAQQDALRRAGIEDFKRVFVDVIVPGRRGGVLPEREKAILKLLSGDYLVVANAGRLGTSQADVLATLEKVGQRNAAVLDAETGETIRWHPDVVRVLAFAQRAEGVNRKEVAAKMSQQRAATGRLGGAPPKNWKVSEEAARGLWNDLSRSVESVAEEVGVSVPTLYRRLGQRGARND